MANNDETILQPQEVSQDEQVKGNKQKKQWQKVAIGGVSGIVLGASGAFAATQIGQEAVETEPEAPAAQAGDHHATHHPRTVLPEELTEVEVSDDMKFGEAFAAARKEVGMAGYFRWKGNLYSTFSKDEWDNLADADKGKYVAQVIKEATPIPHDEPVGPEPNPDPDDRDLISEEPDVHYLGEANGNEEIEETGEVVEDDNIIEVGSTDIAQTEEAEVGNNDLEGDFNEMLQDLDRLSQTQDDFDDIPEIPVIDV